MRRGVGVTAPTPLARRRRMQKLILLTCVLLAVALMPASARGQWRDGQELHGSLSATDHPVATRTDGEIAFSHLNTGREGADYEGERYFLLTRGAADMGSLTTVKSVIRGAVLGALVTGAAGTLIWHFTREGECTNDAHIPCAATYALVFGFSAVPGAVVGGLVGMATSGRED